MEGSNVWWPMKEEGKTPFPTFPLIILLRPSFFSIDLKVYFTMVLGHYSHIFFFFLDL
jgi:hypothetical protein